ncbi:hypothetical protein ACOT81_04390 [Streptomyces sp. WI04-05B]|nr:MULTISPECIES: hypothetical protein [unclassified Streptomyces]MDX2547740.1 hypothetical protein [Streptomyces sp. WI04-05B]MDX2590053.1 hypothetical protein [Streptomyces sp. WI04-05A]
MTHVLMDMDGARQGRKASLPSASVSTPMACSHSPFLLQRFQ